MLSIYALADRLNQPVEVIKDMTMEEFIHWIAFYNIEQQRIKDVAKTTI